MIECNDREQVRDMRDDDPRECVCHYGRQGERREKG